MAYVLLIFSIFRLRHFIALATVKGEKFVSWQHLSLSSAFSCSDNGFHVQCNEEVFDDLMKVAFFGIIFRN